MTDRELKKLSRAELLELLLLQTREVEKLREELAQAHRELEKRQLAIKQSGNLAEAALKLNGVFEAAQAAADQYLENIQNMEQHTKLRCEALLRDARRKSVQKRDPEADAMEGEEWQKLLQLIQEESD